MFKTTLIFLTLKANQIDIMRRKYLGFSYNQISLMERVGDFNMNLSLAFSTDSGFNQTENKMQVPHYFHGAFS